jgi:hypothetical protein
MISNCIDVRGGNFGGGGKASSTGRVMKLPYSVYRAARRWNLREIDYENHKSGTM